MKNSFKILAAVAAFGFAGAANAQSSASASATASARIITPIAINKVCDLRFGSIVPSNESGDVTISGSDRTSTGGVTLITQGSTSYGSAKFNVTGEPSFNFNITVPGTLTLSDGNSHNLSVSTSSPSTGSLDASGAASFHVGGVLSVPANATPGSYTASFDAGVAYQ
jgi:hypothetical protein